MNWTGGFILRDQGGSLCVVPEEVSHQSDVELFWVKEFILVTVNILLTYGCSSRVRHGHSSIGIHLGCLRVGMPVGQVTCTELFILTCKILPIVKTKNRLL